MLKSTKVFLLLIFLQGFDWSFCDGSKALPSAGRTPGIIVPEVVSLSAEDDEGWKPVTDFRKQFPNLFPVKDENNFWTSAHEDNPTAMTTGCDGIMGSRLTLDNCGLCGGDGTSCTVGHGIFRNEALTNDFHLVVTIPVGSTRINITERAQSRSFLALRSRPSGHFFINGKLAKGSPDPSHSYRAAGTFFVYDRPFQSSKGESIWAEGPTNEDIDVLIYFQRENPGIEYDYIVPRATAPPSVGSTNLDLNRDGLLDQRVDTETLDGLDRSYPSAASANSVFNHPPLRRNYYNSYENVNPHPYPPFRQGSRFHPAPQSLDATQKRDLVEISREDRNNIGLTNWENQGFGSCSRSCAGGIKQTIIRCVSTESRAPVEDRYCDADSKPTVRKRRCNRQSCPAFYDVGPWSDCSRTCGYGRRTRKVVCKQQFPGNFTAVVSHKKCRGRARPRPQERCRMRECARWEVVGEWSQCSANCGSGTQTRMIACKLGNGRVMPDGLCPAARRPTPTKSCDAGPCLTGWYVTDWQECSADCDRGIQRRNVFCINTAQSVTGCPSPTEPNSTRSCARNSCGTKYEWFAGQWGTCSSKCGNGVQERKVTCLSVTPEGAMAVAELVDLRTQCDVREKPATEQACNTQACGSRWHYTPWTECSVSCGGGSRTRDVQCLDENRHFSSLCNIAEKPKDAERCNTVSCHSLQDPNCQDELPNCKTVLQARFCGYDFYRKKCCHTCSNGRGAPYRQH
ncbi:thrombospondin type-1 domain-containing protein 4-like isoform X2 [Clavelina lepadiformis]|uniref:thrombospondin type-1 domain-containing protein 4-like isoform X2 n=1 Tax=Clavelina lepadiformis TaxID=159417 RepID=UPI0040417CBF